MKWSLLDMVQEVLNDIDSDEVNSIDDTVEATQVAAIVKSTYFSMMSTRNWPHLRKPIKLTPSVDLAKPTHMYVKTPVKEMDFINYNVRKDGATRDKYEKMSWREPEDFIRICNNLNSDADNVQQVKDSSGVVFNITNDRAPTLYTSFDDETLIFNSYDNEVDASLQSSKIQAMAYVMPEWLPADDFVPDLPENAFMALIEEAKSRAALKLRQVADQKSEQESQRQQRWLSRKARRVSGGIRYPDYGRKKGKGRSTFDKDN